MLATLPIPAAITASVAAPGIVKITTNGRMDGPVLAYQSPDGFIAHIGLTLDQNIVWNENNKRHLAAIARAEEEAEKERTRRDSSSFYRSSGYGYNSRY